MTKTPKRSPLATNLLRLMTEKNLSRRALGRAAGIDHTMVGRLVKDEVSDPGMGVLAQLAIALGVSVDRLIGRPGADAPIPAAAPTELGGLQLLALDQLMASPINPRRTFDGIELTQLAQSIASDGLLQNLVVRPLLGPTGAITTIVRTGDQIFEVVAGERRLRALLQLADEGRWDRAAANVPCRVVAADDVAARAIALLENLQRAELPPLEEARALLALHELDPKRWSTMTIAERIGRTQRYVQQRLALVQKLDPKAQEALAAGKIKVEQARELTGAEPKKQRELLKDMTNAWSPLADRSAAHIRQRIIGQAVLASRAIFPLEAYDGQRVELEDGSVYLVDRKKFDELQEAAAQAKVEELRKRWAWAELEHWFRKNDFEEQRTEARRTGGAVVVLNYNGEIQIEEGLVRRGGTKDAGAHRREAENLRREKEEADRRLDAEAEAEETFKKALFDGLIDRYGVAHRSLVFILLADNEDADYLTGLGLQHAGEDGHTLEEIWAGLDAMSQEDFTRCLCQVAADHLELRHWGQHAGTALLVAKRLGIAIPGHLEPEADETEPADLDPEAEAPIAEVETAEDPFGLPDHLDRKKRKAKAAAA